MARKIKLTKKNKKPIVKSTKGTKKTLVAESALANNAEYKLGSTTLRVHKRTLVIAIVVIVLAASLYFGRALVVAALVNGQPISRIAVMQETEKQSGKQVLEGMIRNTLIAQEASRQKVVVTDKQIDDQIKTLEKNFSKQGQSIDQVLALQGMSQSDLRRIIRLDLMVSKMVEKDVKVTDKEINDYIEKNREILPKDQSEKQLEDTVRERLRQQKLSMKAQEWLAGLVKKAKIIRFVDY